MTAKLRIVNTDTEKVYQYPGYIRHVPRQGDAISILNAQGEAVLEGIVQHVTYVYPDDAKLVAPGPTDYTVWVRVQPGKDWDTGEEDEQQPIPIDNEAQAFLRHYQETHGPITRRIVSAARYCHTHIFPEPGIVTEDLSSITMTVLQEIAEGRVVVSGFGKARCATLREMLEEYKELTERYNQMKLPGFSETVNKFLSWVPNEAVRLVNALGRNAYVEDEDGVVTMQTLEQIAAGELKVRRVGEVRAAQLRDLLEEFYEIEGGTGDGTEDGTESIHQRGITK